jgi:hypothetical protein
MKWLLIIVIAIIALIALMYLIGYFMPVKHVATHSVVLNTTAESAWKILHDYAQYPSWRSDLKKVEVKDDRHWSETSNNGTLDFESEIVRPNELFHTHIVNKDLPFGGSWTYELKSSGTGTELIITENGEVYNPIFRFMSKYIFGHQATLRKYGNDLVKKINSK